MDVSPDLSHAKVFVTLMECDAPAETMAGLNRAAGFLRGRLGERLRLRKVPRLVFEYDATLDRAERVERLLRDSRDDDA
ncbi:MAG: 30S ribosome-binding factor RbfA [Halofilum sp. (in: g-proteobacteria)]|nr:30S ribosome-binding factor RbfA [Halofilum sp. (in: g-proteobacteria)]